MTYSKYNKVKLYQTDLRANIAVNPPQSMDYNFFFYSEAIVTEIYAPNQTNALAL